MTCSLAPNTGHITWSSTRDDEGHRTYKVVYRVESDDHLDGPSVVRDFMDATVTVGSTWVIDNDFDLWAFRLPSDTITPIVTEEPNYWWDVELTFSSKPPANNKQRCNDQKIEDPLMEPPKLSGGSAKYSEEAVFDRFGNPICSSSWELFRGQQNEWDANRTTFRVEMNVISFLQVILALAMRDHVNILPIWGYARRCVKLSSVTWERKFYGACNVYYTLTLDFDTNERTFDRDLLDEGHKCLKGHWQGTTGNFVIDKIGTGADERYPSRFNPTDFVKINDREGNPTKMVLNGFGLPACATIKMTLGGPTPAEYGLSLTRYIKATVPNPDTESFVLSPRILAGASIERHVAGNQTFSGLRRWYEVRNFRDWTGSGNDAPPFWSLSNPYSIPGDVFRSGGKRWLCVASSSEPPEAPNFIEITLIIDRGAWVSGTTDYTLGDYVQMVTTTDPVGTSEYTFTTAIGYMHVERYFEANFLALGVPLFW